MGPTKRFRNDSIGYIKLDQLLGGNSMLFSSLRSSLGSLSQERCTGIWTGNIENCIFEHQHFIITANG